MFEVEHSSDIVCFGFNMAPLLCLALNRLPKFYVRVEMSSSFVSSKLDRRHCVFKAELSSEIVLLLTGFDT